MKVKSILLGLILLSSVATHAGNKSADNGNDINKEKIIGDEQKEARIAVLKARAEEIKAMDLSKLTKDEKKKLKKEVKEMRKEARSLDERSVSIGILGTSLFGVLILLALV
jgi:hypothetical protein